MSSLFPLVTEITKIRGIVSIIKQNKGAIGLSELADEADEDIDDLLPLVEACNILGFTTVHGSSIKLTAAGRKFSATNATRMVRDKLALVEPFRSAMEILRKDGDLTTADLTQKLREKGVALHGEEETNTILLKKMFLRLGIRTRLLFYNAESDMWSARGSS